MQNHTHRLLLLLNSLETGDGIRRARSVSRVLFVVGLILAIFIGLGITFQLHPALIATAAAGAGWVIAERNALRSRVAQWPLMRNYIDWPHVQADLNRDA